MGVGGVGGTGRKGFSGAPTLLDKETLRHVLLLLVSDTRTAARDR